MLFTILAALVLLLLILRLNRNSDFKKLRKHLWCPPSLPIVGSALHFIKDSDVEILPMGEKWMLEHGPNIMLNLFGYNFVALFNPKEVEIILGSNKTIDKSNEYKFFQNWFGLGLLTSTGTKWKSHRKILTPSFHYKILEEFIQVFDKQSDVLIKQLKKHVGPKAIDIFKPISLCTLDIICESAMGTKVNAQEQPDSPFVRSVRVLCSVIYTRVFTPLRFPWIYRFSKTYQTEKKVVKVMRDFSEGIIKTRKQAIAAEKEDGYSEENEVGLKKKYTFLDCLLKSTIDGKPISDEDIREEVDTFMFEGHDTTSIAISFILYCLSKHQDVQEKAYQEIKSVLGSNSCETSIDKLNELKYLEQVIKEGLRLYPPVSVFAREITEETQCGDISIPKGTTVALIPYIYHRNPQIFPDPHSFDPERFSLENQAKRHPYAYIPFSAGPRNCIGQKFAMFEMKCTISRILQHYQILPASPDYEVQPLVRVTLESANGIMMKLKERS